MCIYLFSICSRITYFYLIFFPSQVWDPRQIIRKGRDRHIFLFDLYLLFCKEVKDPGGNKTKYQYKQRLVTSELSVMEHVDGDECKFVVWTARTGANDDKVSSFFNLIRGIIHLMCLV